MRDLMGHRPASCAVNAAAALSLLLIAAGPAWAQAAPSSPGAQQSAPQAAPAPPPQQQQVEPPAPPAREENPGLINELGKLWDKSISSLPKIKSPSETLDDLTNMAKPSTMVTGRMACAVAANGAPDCKLGADRLCQSKGYKEGKSLDTDAAEKCSAKAYIPGRKREPGDCKTENYVIKALCQ
jgi:hypothetical protein